MSYNNNKNYEIKFWNSLIPFFPRQSFIQMTMKVKIDDAIRELENARSRADEEGIITIDFLKKKADESKLYAKETIWNDKKELASETAKQHMPRAKADESPF